VGINLVTPEEFVRTQKTRGS